MTTIASLDRAEVRQVINRATDDPAQQDELRAAFDVFAVDVLGWVQHGIDLSGSAADALEVISKHIKEYKKRAEGTRGSRARRTAGA
ncbi:hypothetical protein ACIRSS_21735 [Amycolatopsis sp. NPDC101161]|uniref:hypothetical protein n=1 Tax=Amycolatopsis sp. NPDC101161 TaxID=3363940 RepID=UPI003814B2E5